MRAGDIDSDIDISIVVPSYQQGRFVRECIDSILAQTGVRVEILVFDSESTDDASEILREYRSRLECWIEKDLGQAHAINKGLKRCRGKIIGYLNSDDVLESGALKYVLERWKEDPRLDLLYGKARYVDESGARIGDYRAKSWDWAEFKGECFICQPAAFWSRRAMERIGLFDQRLVCSIDYDYWLRIAQAGGRIRFIDEYLACSRDYSATKTRSLRKTVFLENFKISLNRLGVIHPFWICQYLDYFKYEKRPKWSAIIPPRGRARDIITKLLSVASKAMARDVTFREVRPKVVY